jgi:hypothetical protein
MLRFCNTIQVGCPMHRAASLKPTIGALTLGPAVDWTGDEDPATRKALLSVSARAGSVGDIVRSFYATSTRIARSGVFL